MLSFKQLSKISPDVYDFSLSLKSFDDEHFVINLPTSNNTLMMFNPNKFKTCENLFLFLESKINCYTVTISKMYAMTLRLF